jgi:hypothetical protein
MVSSIFIATLLKRKIHIDVPGEKVQIKINIDQGEIYGPKYKWRVVKILEICDGPLSSKERREILFLYREIS